ncbi:O-methyltransferase [Desulfobaculum xiamenense]|uniref:O-methyltransferase n=1 Tax=Desulfobaculum xiamenense TaxID=995050 RepID=A0A846QQB8_9BACT|nr:TylF/MycF/NovP-related O-methyltransferase [Desulfobaculum xiamenense]NJB69180.1 O-methyltransferase [Desulfobaculum xiamenense]
MRALRRLRNALRKRAVTALFTAVNRPGGLNHLVSRPTRHWLMRNFDDLHGTIRLDDPRGADLMRLYMLAFNVERLLAEAIPGAFAELGVYRGVTARLLRQLAPQRTLYLFDTFEGLPAQDAQGDPTGLGAGECANTSMDLVLARVGREGVVCCPGHFPETAAAVPDGERFALVHLDCDLLPPTRAGLEFFYPRMSPGGLIIVHDYAGTRWPGVRQAVDEFLATRPESPVLMPDSSCSAIIAICGTTREITEDRP